MDDYNNVLESLLNGSSTMEFDDHTLCPANETDCNFVFDMSEIEKKIKDLDALINAETTSASCALSGIFDSPPCDKWFLHKLLLGYLFPLVYLLCVFGNAANVLTYSGRYLRTSTTVKMLTAKAVLNTLFMTCLTPHFFLLAFDNSGSSKGIFEYYLWASWPYMLFLANISGTSAIWLTVFMTLERYVYVQWPIQSKKWCTTKSFRRMLTIILLSAILLHVQIPITRYVESVPCETDQDTFLHKMYVRNGTLYTVWESVYYWVNFIAALVVPSILLVVFTIKLTHKLMYCSLPNYSERKRCVTRITLATTACELTLETPAMGVYAVAALYGPTFINEDPVMCVCHIITNFANQLNASVCFLIYLLCSAKFRQLLAQRIKILCCKKVTTVTAYGNTFSLLPSRTSRRASDEYICNRPNGVGNELL